MSFSRRGVISLTLLALFTTGCPVRVKEPPLLINPINTPQIGSSTISIPIEVKVSELEKALKNSIKNPISAGQTKELDVRLLAAKRITEKELVKVLVSPATPGYYETRFRQVTENVRESFRCLLTPWKWGTCWRTVTKLVTVPYQQWIDPVEAVYKYVSQDVTKLIDQTYDISGWINYGVYVEELKLDVVGNRIRTTIATKVDKSLDFKQNVIPGSDLIPGLPDPEIKIKGALNCSSNVEITITANLTIADDAKLTFDVLDGDDDTTVKFTKLCVPGAVQAADINSALRPELYVVRRLLKEQINKQLRDRIVEAINKNSGKFEFRDEIVGQVSKISQTKSLGDNIWLVPSIEEILLTDIKGESGTLKFTIGVVARPVVRYSTVKPETNADISKLIIRKVPSIEEESQLLVDGQVLLVDASRQLTTLLGGYAAERFPDFRYTFGTARIYPSGSKAVIAMEILKRSNRKNAFTVYFWGTPKYDRATSDIFLDNLEFTAESRKVFIKYLAAIAEQEVIERVGKCSRFSISEERKKILRKIEDFRHSDDHFEISGGFPELNVSEVFITGESFVVYVASKGKIQLKLKSS